MQKIDGIPVFGKPLPDAVSQIQAIKNYGADFCALMADHHLGYSVPVGGVAAYEGRICVNGVGFDIACGNKAVRLDCDADAVQADIYRIMNEVQSKISFGVGRKNNEKVDHDLFLSQS